MKKLLILLVATVASLMTVAAQDDQAAIKFDTDVHDFGTFPEETGKVTCTFNFTNTGKSDLILQNVRASCGCTTPEWTKTPVKPGETGFVKATYNATGRPGAFTKTITVTSNTPEKDAHLTIKGEVTPKPPKVEDAYPFDMGGSGFRMKNQNVYFNNVNYPSTKTEKVEVINNSTTPMTISFKNAPAYLTVTANPATLAAGAKGEIDITINTKNAKDWGIVNAEFYVLVNNKSVETDNYKMKIFANIVEDFSTLTPEQKASAPVASVGNSISAGDLDKNSKKTIKVSVSNDGKSDLLIRKGSSSNPNITVIAPTKPIKAGKKDDVKVEINTKNMQTGKLSNRITLITNDPNKSVINIQVDGNVK